MELDKFQILKGQSSPDNHGVSVPRTSMCTGAAKISSTVPTRRQNRFVCSESMKGPVFHVERDDTNTFSTIHDQVESEIFNEEGGVVTQGLAVKGVKDGVTCTVCGSGAAIGLTTFAEF
jgi:hypothetical protein